MEYAAFRLRQFFGSRYAREPGIILLAYVPYFLARGHAVSHGQSAFENAARLIRLEQSLGLFKEVSLQSAAFSFEALIHAFNIVYFYGHWPVIIGCGVYLFVKHPRVYVITRNAFLISGAVALVLYALFPVAPPRLTPGFVADTLSMTIPVSLDKSRLVNPYAALPSLHVGWDLLIALGLFVATRRWSVRTIALLLPPTMMLATVVTGNHFFVDGIAGALLALAAFFTASWLYRRWPGIQQRAIAFATGKRVAAAAANPGHS